MTGTASEMEAAVPATEKSATPTRQEWQPGDAPSDLTRQLTCSQPCRLAPLTAYAMACSTTQVHLTRTSLIMSMTISRFTKVRHVDPIAGLRMADTAITVEVLVLGRRK